MDAQLEALAAWMDGEPVSRTEVARALETPEGREYVLDLMALRHLVAVTTPGAAASETPRRARRWPAFAAAAAVLCVAGGYAAGRVTTPALPGPPASPSGIVPTTLPPSIAAPAPTRVIQLGEGTDWRETIGGS